MALIRRWPRTPWRKPPGPVAVNRAHPITNGLMAAWTMQEGAGDFVADATGIGAGGHASESVTNNWRWVGTPYGRGVYLPTATAESVETPSHARFDGAAVTIVYGFKADSFNAITPTSMVARHDSGTSKNGFMAYLDTAGKPSAYAKANSGSDAAAQAATALTAGRWHQGIAQGTQGGSVVAGIDGVLGTPSGSLSWTWNANPVRFFRSTDGFWATFQGTLAYVYWWNRILSADELAFLARNPFVVLAPSPAQRLWPRAIVYPNAVPVTGAGGVTFGIPALSGAGVHAASAITIIGPALSGAGTVGISGSGGVTIPKPHLSGTGVVIVSPVFGVGSITVAAPRLSGRGAVGITGTGGIVIPGPMFQPPSTVPVVDPASPPLVTLTNTGTITRPLPVSRLTYTAAALRQIGQASIFVPRTSDACDAAYINEIAPFWVTIRHTALGRWDGFSLGGVRERAEGISIEAHELAALLDRQRVPSGLVFAGVTAGVVVGQAVRLAMAALGSGAITVGTLMEAPPVVAYEFTGQTVMEVLTAMMERTGHEWVLADRRLSWVARAGGYRAAWLCHDFDIVADERRADFANQAGAVTVRTPDGQFVTGVAG